MQLPSLAPRIPQLPLWLLIVLFLAYALPGNIGHVAWRGDDVQHIDMAYEMLQSGDWLIPRIAGAASTSWPPMTYWVGAITGSLLGWLLPMSDAIRLVTVIALALTVWPLRAAATRLFNPETGNAVLLLSLASLGLLIHAHEAQPQMVLLASFSCLLYGLVRLREQPLSGGLISGIATGSAMLATGLGGLLLTAPLILLLPIFHADFRQKKQLGGLLLAVISAVIVMCIWLVPLQIYYPRFSNLWWQREIAFLLPLDMGGKRFKSILQLMAWFSWPLWPVALWALWNRRKQLFSNVAYVLPLIALVLSLYFVITSESLRPANALPILPPLLLLAGGEVLRLRRGAANAFDWFGIMVVCCVGLFLWVAWSALHLGWPAPLGRNILRLTPGFQESWNGLSLGIAFLLCVGWAVSIFKLPFSPLRGAIHWALGITIMWCLTAVLWQDWFNYDKNYTPIMSAISKQVAQHSTTDCLVGLGVGDAQRAAINYFAKLKVDVSSSPDKRCDMLIAYASARNALPEPENNGNKTWEKVWQKEKGSGRQAERFALYRQVK